MKATVTMGNHTSKIDVDPILLEKQIARYGGLVTQKETGETIKKEVIPQLSATLVANDLAGCQAFISYAMNNGIDIDNITIISDKYWVEPTNKIMEKFRDKDHTFYVQEEVFNENYNFVKRLSDGEENEMLNLTRFIVANGKVTLGKVTLYKVQIPQNIIGDNSNNVSNVNYVNNVNYDAIVLMIQNGNSLPAFMQYAINNNINITAVYERWNYYTDALTELIDNHRNILIYSQISGSKDENMQQHEEYFEKHIKGTNKTIKQVNWDIKENEVFIIPEESYMYEHITVETDSQIVQLRIPKADFDKEYD